MANIRADARRYARMEKTIICNSLDYYVWKMLKSLLGDYIPEACDIDDIEDIVADLFIEYMNMNSDEKKKLHQEFMQQFPRE